MRRWPQCREAAELGSEAVEALRAAARRLTGVALGCLGVLGGAATPPQLQMLAVLAGPGMARLVQAARVQGSGLRGCNGSQAVWSPPGMPQW